MIFPSEMMHENVWFDRPKYEEEMENYQMFLTNNLTLQVSKSHDEIFTEETRTVAKAAGKATSPLINEIEKARQNIRQTLSGSKSSDAVSTVSSQDVSSIQAENAELRKLVSDLASQVKQLTLRVEKLEGGSSKKTDEQSKPAAASQEDSKDDDDDFDLFGSDEEDEETEEEKKKREEKVAAYDAKKQKKPALIPKSSIVLDIKPWDDETDLKEMERLIRTIEVDGLVWAQQSKIIPVAYGIKKLQIGCVVEDDKVGTDLLEEEITKFEDHVQSVDVVAFNKI